MNKRIITISIALLIALMLNGCKANESKPSLEIMPNDDNTISITADKAEISGMMRTLGGYSGGTVRD